jgi:hypothetical protein
MERFHNLRRSNPGANEYFDGKHRLEHWYRDNQVYFITARTRNGVHAFASDEAKAIFFDRFDFYTKRYNFVPWVTSLLSNHYHTIGYLYHGDDLGPMMQKIHGSVAKLVNDTLAERHLARERSCTIFRRVRPRRAPGSARFPLHADPKQSAQARFGLPDVPAHACQCRHRPRRPSRPRVSGIFAQGPLSPILAPLTFITPYFQAVPLQRRCGRASLFLTRHPRSEPKPD